MIEFVGFLAKWRAWIMDNLVSTDNYLVPERPAIVRK